MQRSSALRSAHFAYLFAALMFIGTYFPVAAQSGGDALAQTVVIPNNVQLNFYPPTVSIPTAPPQPTPSVHAPQPIPQAHTAPAPAPKIVTTPPPAPINPNDTAPARLVIPAIGLDAPIVGVGVTAGGDMAVPNGKTNNVGWYKDGPVPGAVGAAVLDAHVFAAFSKLKNIKPGDDIYVITAGNQKLHFVVSAAKNFALSSLTSGMLFTQTNSHALNLITCAGSLTPDHSTYDHRLIVYSTLAS
ncbi:MAG TPA: sortase [Candidatus Paceibacterota bacterium]|nr:sortase [Candidatus Paceibacterota bacterium]